MKQAVILAGGKGTRLRSVLAGLPKPLAEVAGERLLGHQLALLRKHGFTEAVILVSHGAKEIADWVDSRGDLGITVRLVDDGAPRGTAGAVLAALPLLASEFMVMYADTMVGADLSRFWDWHHAAPEAAGSLFLHPNDHPADSDLVEVNSEARVLALHPYPHPDGVWLPNLVNAALYILSRDALEAWVGEPHPIDFGKNLFPLMVARGQILRGYNSPEYIKDAGTPSRLERVRRDFLSGAVERASLDRPQRAVFIDRDGTLNAEAGHIKNAQDLQVFPFVGQALKRLNENEWRSIVITNQPVLARGDATEDDMRSINARLDNEVARDHAYFDRLYLCPHHPDKGFTGEVAELKIECACRKPSAGLIHRAKADLNIDLAQSWFIGDSTADLGAAEAAGVSSILVRTGNAGLDEHYPYEPGFSQADFAAAVDFILVSYPQIAQRCASISSQIRESQVIFVGGLSRAGKSTVAATLARELRLAGHDVVVIHLDRWILGLEERGTGVLGRYDMNGILAAARMLGERQSSGTAQISLPTYSRKTRRGLMNASRLVIDKKTIVIWEGVVALEVAAKLDQLEMSVAVHADERKRRMRFEDYDICRGLDSTASEQSWSEREKDEHPMVRESLKRASYAVSLDDILVSPSSSVFQ